MDMMDDSGQQDATASVGGVSESTVENKAADTALVKRILKTIKADKKHHEKAFKNMRRDMHVAMHGSDTNWSDDNYRANISGRHVRQKTATLYAKNPKAIARRRETMDFTLWDEDPASLALAMQTLEQGAQAIAAAQMMTDVDPVTGEPIIDPMTGMPAPAQPQLPPGYQEAEALIEDFKQGMERRLLIKKFGKTLELLFAQAQRDQKPVDFKSGMKQCVRRACTTGVGYVELGFQREKGPRAGVTEQLADYRARIEHLRVLAEKAAEGEIDGYSAEIAELEKSLMALEQEPEIIVREGLIVDFPQSTRVIPDKLCTQLTGFVNARHITLEYHYKKSEIPEIFPGVDLGKDYTPYSPKDSDDRTSDNYVCDDEQGDLFSNKEGNNGNDDLVCVYKHYDKLSGLVYFVCEGHPNFLRPPAAPDVFVSDFWPVYALTFNAVESETELFPPSDVALLLSMQNEYNRSRQGKREHRQAARPRWAYSNGSLDEEDIEALKSAKAFDAIALSMGPDADLRKVLQGVPVPGVDPNLYDVNEVFGDMQVVVGTQQAQLGGLSKVSATETAVSANASAAGDSSSIDDLDAFLTCVARAAGQILMREMSEEQVQRIAGRGYVWLDQTQIDIYEEIALEVEAGSTGKPNQAVEINNWREMLPFLIQIPGISQTWLARESIRRLDDKVDLTEALAAGMPSIVMQNQQAQPSTGDPSTDPNAQGAQGGDNAPAPQGDQSGTSAPMGDNNPTPGIIRYGADGGRL